MTIAISRTGLWLTTGLDALRLRYVHIRSALATAAVRRRRYRATYSELVGLSDRDLADLGIARRQIHRIAREESMKDMPHETA